MHIVRIFWLWLQVCGGALALIALGWLIAQSVLRLRLLNVQTGSMRPAFQPHDVLIMQRMGQGALRPGEIVSYESPRNPNELVTHRIVRVIPQTHSIQTKGDALSQADPVVRDSLVVGRVVAVLPDLGRPLTWLHSWIGLAACVYLPAIAIAGGELYKFEQAYKRGRFYAINRA